MATSQDPLETNGHHSNSRHVNRIPPTDDLEYRDSSEIKHRIDQTRGAMDETLDELSERLNPRNLFDDVISIFRSPQTRDTAKHAGAAAGDFANNLGRQVRDNPIGATLVGAGLAWLALGSRRDEYEDECEPIPRGRALQDDYLIGIDDREPVAEYDSPYYTDEDLLLREQDRLADDHPGLLFPSSDFDDESESVLDRATRSAKSTASSTSEKVSGAASSAGEAISDTASAFVDGVKSAASSVGDAVSSAGSKTSGASRRAYLRSRATARDAARGTRRLKQRTGRGMSSASDRTEQQISALYDSAERRVRRAHQESPLALGLGIMALGAIAGALIPRTRPEDEWMGETSDETIHQARQQAEETYQRGQHAVENTIETAKHSAETQGLTGESLAERATRVAEKAAGSINEAVKEEGLHPKQLKDDAKVVAHDTKDQAKVETEKSQT
ncbi:DUF3618 domain-containing protein [Neorhodopirellula pilleata]|uniref:DUF3618 domain-containing protein n=1 Tax=Neorhodopirellula pilleata TaxID=2714738 RepID=A0A5C6AWH8_9BACT|nr:DUF3618 domain-containing protein [Neorhodopirellula pilleata]TWU03857.1 hypothetical protein Pla100_07920 [Neorhodopirellula pilleata]